MAPRPRRWFRFAVLAPALLGGFLLPGCGGVFGVFALFLGNDDSNTVVTTAVDAESPDPAQAGNAAEIATLESLGVESGFSGPIAFKVTLTAPREKRGIAAVRFRAADEPAGGAAEASVEGPARSASFEILDRQVDASDTRGFKEDFTLQWRSDEDLPARRARVRLEVEASTGEADDVELLVDNTSPPDVRDLDFGPDPVRGGLAKPGAGVAMVLGRNLRMSFALADQEGEAGDREGAGVRAFFVRTDIPGDSRVALPLGVDDGGEGDFSNESLLSLETGNAPDGVAHSLLVPTDLVFREQVARGFIEVVAFDTRATTLRFPTDGELEINNTTPDVTVSTFGGDQTGRVPLRIRVLDASPNDGYTLAGVEVCLFGEDGPLCNLPASPAIGFPNEFQRSLGAPERMFRSDGTERTFVWNSNFDLDEARRGGLARLPATARAVCRVTIEDARSGERITRETEEFLLSQLLVSTVAGGGVGDGVSDDQRSVRAPLFEPFRMHCLGQSIFFCDRQSQRIRVVEPDEDVLRIRTIAGNGFQGYDEALLPARRSSLDDPADVAAAPDGRIYIADRGNGLLRMVDPATGLLVPFPPPPPGEQARRYKRPSGVAVCTTGAGRNDYVVYLAETGADRVWRFDRDGNEIIVSDAIPEPVAVDVDHVDDACVAYVLSEGGGGGLPLLAGDGRGAGLPPAGGPGIFIVRDTTTGPAQIASVLLDRRLELPRDVSVRPGSGGRDVFLLGKPEGENRSVLFRLTIEGDLTDLTSPIEATVEDILRGGAPEQAPPVQGLRCVQASANVQVPRIELCWLPPIFYETVIVRRSGTQGDTEFVLPGTSTRFVDRNPPRGRVVYSVEGRAGGLGSDPQSCEIDTTVPLFGEGDPRLLAIPRCAAVAAAVGSEETFTISILNLEDTTFVVLGVELKGPSDLQLENPVLDFIPLSPFASFEFDVLFRPRNVGFVGGSVSVILQGSANNSPSVVEVPIIASALPVPRPAAFICRETFEGDIFRVALTWQNPVAFDAFVLEIENSRGTRTVALPGSATSFLDEDPDDQGTTYRLRGSKGGFEGPAAECFIGGSGGALFMRGIAPPPLVAPTAVCATENQLILAAGDTTITGTLHTLSVLSLDDLEAEPEVIAGGLASTLAPPIAGAETPSECEGLPYPESFEVAPRASQMISREVPRSGALAATEASLGRPVGVAVDEETNTLFVADTQNDRVVAVDLATGLLDDLSAPEGLVDRPSGLALEPAMHKLFAGNRESGEIVSWDVTDPSAPSPAVVAFAGFDEPRALALDRSSPGGALWILDGTTRVSRIELASGTRTNFDTFTVRQLVNAELNCAGSYETCEASFPLSDIETVSADSPRLLSLAVDRDGRLFLALEYETARKGGSMGVNVVVIETIDAPAGRLDAVHVLQGAGQDACVGRPLDIADLITVGGMAFDRGGNLYLSDGSAELPSRGRVYRVSRESIDERIAFQPDVGGCARAVDVSSLCDRALDVSRIAGSGDGVPRDAEIAPRTAFAGPTGIAIDSLGNLWVADSLNQRVRRFWAGASR